MASLTLNVGSLRRHFESLVDPRDTRNRRHRLVDVLVSAVCAVTVGCGGPTAIARWARKKRAWLATFLELPDGIPARDCFRRVLSAVKPAAFQQCFESLIAAGLAEQASGAGRLIAVAGQTLRRSHDRAAGRGPLPVVSAWATAYGLALGQVATAEKAHEITALPEWLEQIDVRGAVVTIDAMGCQRDIAQQIVAGGGDYVLAVKDHPPKLHAAMAEFFTAHLADDFAQLPPRSQETQDEGHGRVDERYDYTAKLPANFPLRIPWPGLQALGCAIRHTTRPDGTVSDEVRYYLASRDLSGTRFAAAVRKHWGSENSLHWVLEMNFREDEDRTRERILGNN